MMRTCVFTLRIANVAEKLKARRGYPVMKCGFNLRVKFHLLNEKTELLISCSTC